MLDPSKLEKCVRRFQEEPGILAVWGLGSAFSGRTRAGSDVDFAILYSRSHAEGFDASGRLLLDLECCLGRTVDLGRLSTRNLIYAYQAISRGTLLYDRDPKITIDFVGRVLSLYADLKLDRRVVEEAYCVG